jgi:hypothetical protein
MMSTNHTLFMLAIILLTYRVARNNPHRLELGTSVLVRAALQTAVLAPLVASRANWYYFAAMIAFIGASDLTIGALAGTRPRNNEYTPETIGLFLRVAVILFFAGNPRFIPGFNGPARSLAALMQANSVVAASITQKGFRDLLLMLSGVLLAGFDINCLVALILKQSHLMPSDVQTAASAAKEAGRGRIIGILERSIVFVLIVRGNFSAVGLILAAKAIARFKDLDQRDFAEYVLIGTLLSISLAIAVAFFLQSI